MLKVAFTRGAPIPLRDVINLREPARKPLSSVLAAVAIHIPILSHHTGDVP
jgi:hypothetical protein